MVLAGIIILSLVVLTGYAGQVLTRAVPRWPAWERSSRDGLVSSAGWPFEVAFVAGIVAATAIGLLFALPALRTRGVNLAVITLSLGVAVQEMAFKNSSYTGGLDGTPLPPTSVLGIDIDPITHLDRYTVFCIVWFIVVCFLVANLRRGRVAGG